MRRCRRPMTTNRSPGSGGCGSIVATSAAIGSGHSSIRPDGVRRISGIRGCSGPRSTPCGCGAAAGPGDSPYGPRSRSRRVAAMPRGASAGRRPVSHVRAPCRVRIGDQRAAAMSLSSSAPGGQRHGRRREVGDVAHREVVEREVVVGLLAGRRRRQDHVGVPGGLVHVRVDAHHEVQPGDRRGRAGRRWARTAPGCRRR